MRLCKVYMEASRTKERAEREGLFKDIQRWYLGQYKDFELLLKTDMISQLADRFKKQIEGWDQLSIQGYKANSSAKGELFDRVEHTCKLMLSVYTYGPDSTFPATLKKYGSSWFDCSFNFHILIEMVQAQLRANNEGEGINLAVFLEDRSFRNDLDHNGKALECVSVIRCYNVLREMLIFLDTECRSNLPRFTYPEEISCDSQHLMQWLKNIDFRSESTLLVVSPIHDLKPEALKILSNLPWSAVIDLDGYTSFGGLRYTANNSCINEQLLNEQTARSFAAKRGLTAWFICGQFVNFTYWQPNPNDLEWDEFLNKNKIRFDGKTAFGDQYQMEKCIKPIIKEFSSLMRPLSVLYIHDYDDDNELARCIINECEQVFHKKDLQYSMTAVYYDLPSSWDQHRRKLTKAYAGSNYPFPLFNLYCDLDSMADGLIQFQQDLPILVANTDPFRLPSDKGTITIGQVLANNLSDCFDVLYEDVGDVSAEEAEQHLNDFFRGGIAEWSVFRSGQVVSLYPERENNKLEQRIINLLSYIPDSKSSRIITILHTPGIGGSTLLRRIGWDLHTDYPVLMVKRYDNQISNLVKNLYDKQKKGVLLLADDTINDLEQLKKTVRTLDRPCALVLTARDRGNDRAKENNTFYFSSIDQKAEPQLRKRFRDYSVPYKELSQSDKEKKEANYAAFIRQEGMRCPFMIGLYYQEKDFSGVTGYVSRMMQQVQDLREIKTLAILALFSKYAGVGLPLHFINKYLQVRTGSNYIKQFPYVKAVLITVPEELLGKYDTYKLKHILISSELLEQCCQRLYGTNIQNSITDLSSLVINAIFDAYRSGMDEVYEYLLDALFISQEETSFSSLIMDAVSPSSRKEILYNLASKFDGLTQQYAPEDADGLYRMTAHFYGHLGRLCHNKEYGLGNPAEAVPFCERAVDLMEKASQSHDPVIYHMLGIARRALFRSKLKEFSSGSQNDPDASPTAETYEAFDRELEEIRSIFEKTANYGSVGAAISGMIGLNLSYLEWIRCCECDSALKRNAERQAQCRNEIESLFEWSYSIELNDESRRQIQKYELEYPKYRNSSDDIQHFENLLNNLKGKVGVDEDILTVRKCLITARLAQHSIEVKNNPGKYVVINREDLNSILVHLEEVLGSKFNPNDFRQRQNRIICYDRWFYLAKMPGAGRSLEKGISYSERWIELEEQCGGYDSRPYYYYAVCSLLYKRAGNYVDMQRIRSCWKHCEDLGGDTNRLRDIIVSGEGLNQLLDMRFSAGNPNEYLEKAGKTPQIVQGSFDQIAANRGYITLIEPHEWERYSVKFTRGRGNLLGEHQLTHRMATFAGFSYEGFHAVDKYVRDITAGEEWPSLERPNPAEETMYSKRRKQSEQKTMTAQSAEDYLHSNIMQIEKHNAKNLNDNSDCEMSVLQSEKACRRPDNAIKDGVSRKQSEAKKVNNVSNNAGHNQTKVQNTDNTHTTKADPQIVGRAIVLKPIEITKTGCIGVFEINDVQYSGQILYANIKKNCVDEVRKEIIRAKEKSKAIQGFKIGSVSPEGIYILKLRN